MIRRMIRSRQSTEMLIGNTSRALVLAAIGGGLAATDAAMLFSGADYPLSVLLLAQIAACSGIILGRRCWVMAAMLMQVAIFSYLALAAPGLFRLELGDGAVWSLLLVSAFVFGRSFRSVRQPVRVIGRTDMWIGTTRPSA